MALNSYLPLATDDRVYPARMFVLIKALDQIENILALRLGEHDPQSDVPFYLLRQTLEAPEFSALRVRLDIGVTVDVKSVIVYASKDWLSGGADQHLRNLRDALRKDVWAIKQAVRSAA